MIRFCFSVILCAWMSFSIHAQNTYWQQPSSQITNVVNCMYFDTMTNRLLLGAGSYLRSFDGTLCPIMGSNLGGGPRSIFRYNGILYIGTALSGNGFMKWSGSSWDTTGISANGLVTSMCVYNGEMYVGGLFSHIAGINAQGLAKFDGLNWSAVSGFPFSGAPLVYSIAEYNGELYVGGQFLDSTGNVMNIARWNGSQWNNVGVGFNGGMAEVACFTECNGILYIGGSFDIAQGNVSNYVAQWDGNTLSDVGGGTIGVWSTNGQVFDLFTYHNEVYAAGVFSYAGGVFADRIAKWDGTNWCGFGDTLSNGVLAVAEYNDTLYMGGAFYTIDSDTVIAFAKWTGGNYVDTCGNTTFISEQESNNRVSVYPNPVSDEITFEFPTSENRLVIIYDYTGKEIWRDEPYDNAISISVSDFAAGLYFYSVIDDQNQTTSGKFVVEH